MSGTMMFLMRMTMGSKTIPYKLVKENIFAYTLFKEIARMIADRRKTYGEPREHFAKIAKVWSVYLDKEISPKDVCVMMMMLKIVRLSKTNSHRDSMLDVIGYAVCDLEI